PHFVVCDVRCVEVAIRPEKYVPSGSSECADERTGLAVETLSAGVKVAVWPEREPFAIPHIPRHEHVPEGTSDPIIAMDDFARAVSGAVVETGDVEAAVRSEDQVHYAPQASASRADESGIRSDDRPQDRFQIGDILGRRELIVALDVKSGI